MCLLGYIYNKYIYAAFESRPEFALVMIQFLCGITEAICCKEMGGVNPYGFGLLNPFVPVHEGIPPSPVLDHLITYILHEILICFVPLFPEEHKALI